MKILRVSRRHILMLGLLMFVLMVSVTPAFAQETIALDFDLDSFINSINAFLPLAIQIVGFAAGIAIAFAIAMFVANSLLNAFKGNSI
jgi:hypothetical protein